MTPDSGVIYYSFIDFKIPSSKKFFLKIFFIGANRTNYKSPHPAPTARAVPLRPKNKKAAGNSYDPSPILNLFT